MAFSYIWTLIFVYTRSGQERFSRMDLVYYMDKSWLYPDSQGLWIRLQLSDQTLS